LGKEAVEISHYVPAFEVEINGRRLEAEVSKVISNITIEQEVNKTNNFRFVVQDEFMEGEFRWLGHDLFKFGNDVAIKLGYVGNMHKMVVGQIQNITANFFSGVAPTFTVEGVDSAYKFLMEKSEPRTFRDKKDSEIVKEIAKDVHLNAVVDDTELVRPIKRKKGGESYFRFINELASSNDGFEISLSERDLFFVKAKEDKEAVMSLRWGHELINFRPSLNTSQAITEVIVRSWDREGKRTIEGRAVAGEEGGQEGERQVSSQIAREIYGDVVRVVTERPVRSVDEARREALGVLRRTSNNLIKGSGETIGIPDIKPGVCIELEDLGNWFKGKYYVEKVSHKIDTSGYRTTFDVRRNRL
jgi:phage protein D